MATIEEISSNNGADKEWERPSDSLHAHFDCFSGAAGDMMLAACLDAAGEDQSKLLMHVQRSIEQGMPELAGEFSITAKQVWRGMGSIAAQYIQVSSKYGHEAAPVPSRVNDTGNATGSDAVLGHNHDHQHSLDHDHQHNHSHRHSHSHNQNQLESGHEHSHDHSHNASPTADHSSSVSDIPHSHSHAHASSGDNHNHSHNHSHGHSHQSTSTRGPLRNLPQIRKMLLEAPMKHIPTWVQEHAIAAFTELAHAEAKTHGAASSDAVHFHEVGAVDSIVDTVGTLLALHALGVTSVSCSRLPLGEGTVWTDHGLLPVPAPATLRLMMGMPTCPGPKGITGELVTPTAAALLRVLVQQSAPSSSSRTIEGRPPAFTIRQIGIGAGTKDFEKHPNILRLILGDCLVDK